MQWIPESMLKNAAQLPPFPARSTAGILPLLTAELEPWEMLLERERDLTSHTHLVKGNLALPRGQARSVQQGTAAPAEEKKSHCSYLMDKFEVSLHQKEFKFTVTDFGFPPSELD